MPGASRRRRRRCRASMAAAYQLGYRIAIMVAQRRRALDRGRSRLDGRLYDDGRDRRRRHRDHAADPRARAARRAGVARAGAARRRVARAARRTGPQSLQQLGSWFVGAVVCPFVDFFTRYGTRLALLMLAFIASYRLTDFTMGVMTNPFYLDLGFSLKQIAAVAKGFGVVHVDPRHAARRRRGRAARHREVAGARQPAGDRVEPDVRDVRVPGPAEPRGPRRSSSAPTTSRWAWPARR